MPSACASSEFVAPQRSAPIRLAREPVTGSWPQTQPVPRPSGDRAVTDSANAVARRCRTCGSDCSVTSGVTTTLASGDAEAFERLLAVDGGPLAEICRCEQLMDLYHDHWMDDEVVDAEVALGLCVALAAYRRRVSNENRWTEKDRRCRLLVAGLPDRPHVFSAALAVSALDAAGYPVVHCLPRSADDLAERVAAGGYAGVVLACSGVFRDAGSIASIHALTETIRHAHPSKPRVVLYGRVARIPGVTASAGADAAFAAVKRLLAYFGQIARDPA